MFTSAFWKATFERMIRTFAQALLALLVGDGIGFTDIDWPAALSVAGLAAVAALLTAIVASGIGAPGPGITEVPTDQPVV